MTDQKDYLNVWYNKILVGELWRDNTERIGFHYDKHWSTQGFAISQQLPLDNSEYSSISGKAQQFFVNLLPEANARRHIIKNLKINDSDFELLKAIGGECAGALSILPLDLKPASKFIYRKLSDEEFKKILLRKGIIFDFYSMMDRPRLSLAGAQDKCPVFYNAKDYFLPQDAAPSTHILKFEIQDYRNIPLYEYALTMLAKKIGLPVIDAELFHSGRQHYLLTKRYDRIFFNEQKIKRIHQEDFCQALGFSYAKKYQQDGGPTFKDCYHLIQRVSIKPLEDAENLLNWQIFNFLAGNSDGHAKNLALLYKENYQPQLAPFYDLVCTRAVEGIDTNLALSIGDEFDPDKISLMHWKKLADECNIRNQFLFKLIHTMAIKLVDALSEANEEFTIALNKYPAIQRVKEKIIKQCKRTLKQFD